MPMRLLQKLISTNLFLPILFQMVCLRRNSSKIIFDGFVWILYHVFHLISLKEISILHDIFSISKCS